MEEVGRWDWMSLWLKYNSAECTIQLAKRTHIKFVLLLVEDDCVIVV